MRDVQILTLSCRDRPGITARVTGYLFDKGGNVIEAQQFNDLDDGEFFMRVSFDPGPADPEALRAGFTPLAAEFGMHWTLRSANKPRKVLILVSKFDHCLGDLLYRMNIDEMPMDVVGIVCNHPREALNISLIGDIPFHHMPVSKESKPAQEAQIRALIKQTGAELVVLARYMQILSDEMAAFLSGSCINIHHSVSYPAFKGAKPYSSSP